jgi:hypothetical protein
MRSIRVPGWGRRGSGQADRVGVHKEFNKGMAMRFLLGCTVLLACAPAFAKVSQNDADQLRTRLTPLGAERAGNASGTIPEWRGGLTAPPPCHRDGARYCDPHAGETPYATITAANLEEWRDKLSAAQIALLTLYPDSYRLPVYPSRRTFANPPGVYEAAYQNALKAALMPSGNAVREASLAVPFPIPKHGAELAWNHRLRWRGPGYTRSFSQASVTPSGEAHLVTIREDADFPYARGEAPEDGAIQRWLWLAMQPERLHGFLTLFHDSLDAENHPTQAWVQQPRDPGKGRIRKSRSFGFDNPAMLSDDLRLDDQYDAFSGSPERYSWRLIAKREMVAPYNAYPLHDGRRTVRELIQRGHPNPALTRYELHRVWVVEATLKPKALHRAKRRTFYFDEDSWQILMVDLYDRADRLWRAQEVHPIMAYDRATLIPAVEVLYDLDSSRYLLTAIDENDPERVERAFEEKHFTPAGARDAAPR